MQIFDKCSVNQSNHVVILANSSNPFLKSQIRKAGVLSLVGLNYSETVSVNEYGFKTERSSFEYFEAVPRPFPAEFFLITQFDLSFLSRALENLRKSVWWNVYGSFIIQSPNKVDSCQDAYSYLRIIWKFNILNVIYICLDSNLHLQLYTFNPYSQTAPIRWSKVQSVVQENGHPLTIFKYSSELHGNYM